MTDLKRQQFEAHMRSLKSYSLFRYGDGYVDLETQTKWELWQLAWQAALASQQPADDDWIEWAGGDCPVEFDVMVEAKFADGYQNKYPAGVVGWKWANDHSDIIAYRVVKP